MKHKRFIIPILIFIVFANNTSESYGQSIWNMMKETANNTFTEFKETKTNNTIKRKSVTVKLTGATHEAITMKFSDGTLDTIQTLPYEFKVAKSSLPMTVELESPNYSYSPITIVKKPQGGIGHVYTVISKEKTRDVSVATTTIQKVVVQKEKADVTEKKPQIDWSRAINKAPQVSKKAENTFALIIANEEYDLVSPVAMANNDGLVFKEYCHKTLGLGEHNIKYYPNATYGNMARAFREIKEIAEAFEGNINLIFYYAGHGIPDNSTKDAFLMPVDADGTDTGVCYSLKKVYDDIDKLKLKQCVMFMDACFSGAKRDEGMIVAARGVAIKAKEEKPKSSTIVFTATSDDEAAYSYNDEQHGLFTYYLLKKLQETKGQVTLGELANYLTTKVKQNSILINGKKQTPTVMVSDEFSKTWKNLKLSK